MRVSNNMMYTQSLRDVNSNHERLLRLNKDLSTTERIHRPSDDPTGHARAYVLKNSIDQNEQFKKNAAAAQDFLSITDTTLGSVMNILQRLRELAVQTANGTLKLEDREATAKEVQQSFEELRSWGNTKVNNRYIFGGVKTDQEVFPAAGVNLGPNDAGTMGVEVAPNVMLTYNIRGIDVFGNTTLPGNMFDAVDNFYTALTTNNQASIGQTIADMDKWIKTVNNSRTEVGSRVNRVEMAQGRLAEINVSLDSLLGDTVGADIPKTTTEFAQTQATLQAALMATSKSLPMSLVDFLR